MKAGRIGAGSANFHRYKSIEVNEQRSRDIDNLLINRPLQGKDNSQGSKHDAEEENHQIYFNDYE